MILVLVGTERGFDRLIAKVDDLAVAGELPDAVFCQIGSGAYCPSVAYARMLSYQDTRARTVTADLVICHAGPGCILPTRAAGRPLVVVPRLHRFGEAVDDHQVDFARHLQRYQGVTVVEDLDRLGATVRAVFADGPATPSADDAEPARAALVAHIDRLVTGRRARRTLPGSHRRSITRAARS